MKRLNAKTLKTIIKFLKISCLIVISLKIAGLICGCDAPSVAGSCAGWVCSIIWILNSILADNHIDYLESIIDDLHTSKNIEE